METYGSPNAAAQAANLLARFGTLQRLAQADWRAVQVITRDTALTDRIVTAIQFGRELLNEQVTGIEIGSSAAIKDLLRTEFGGLRHERLLVLYVDTGRRLICVERAAEGCLDECAVFPRQLIRRALEVDAAGLVLSHNHPSGSAEPSQADLAMTRRVADCAAAAGVRVLDHLIYAADQLVSCRERGLL